MRKFFGFLNDYVVEFDWKDLAIFKLCLCAFGMMIGLSVPKDKRKPVLFCSGLLFVATTVLLFARLFGMECPFCKEDEMDEDEMDEDEGTGFVMRITADEE